MIEVIENKKEWNKELELLKDVDFYHTYDYHHLSKNSNESAVLIKYTDGSTSLFLPLLIRDIDNSIYKDATSVYGYSGVLSLNMSDKFKTEEFYKELNVFFNDYKIISVFSRLHPFVNHQEAILSGLGTVANLGKVVYIDLTDTIENQRKMFNKRMKSYLNASRKSCTVIESKLENHLQTFIKLYHENMKRVDADTNYFFEDSYFHQLLTSTDFSTKLYLCSHNETQQIIGGALFIEKGGMVQYHLSGYDEDYHDLNAIKLIIDEVRIRSTQNNFTFLNLGGGRGSKEDSLFTFKKCFSKNTKQFKIWKYIVNEEVYGALVQKYLGSSLMTESNEFFPAYRVKGISSKQQLH